MRSGFSGASRATPACSLGDESPADDVTLVVVKVL